MAARDCTTVMLDEASTTEKDLRSKTMSDGIIELRQKQSSYGADRRALRVSKLRGCSYVSGSHDVTIATGGLTVHPRLVAQSFPSLVTAPALGSGNSEIDALVGGGLPRGSNTLIAGPAGVGKSTISSLYAMAAAKCGEKCALFLFDESEESYIGSQRRDWAWTCAPKSKPAALNSGILIRPTERRRDRRPGHGSS